MTRRGIKREAVKKPMVTLKELQISPALVGKSVDRTTFSHHFICHYGGVWLKVNTAHYYKHTKNNTKHCGCSIMRWEYLTSGRTGMDGARGCKRFESGVNV
ncbi:hypothetical protein AMECASPLE_022994 [Ameca splendens]|uniref:Uncharacterized protein n=1 Tax=Ameca splendens TaxID=208324 RepID=A0ABV0ZCU2_9TELE